MLIPRPALGYSVGEYIYKENDLKEIGRERERKWNEKIHKWRDTEIESLRERKRKKERELER